ncbi:GNAT family N-acetyltransferase [Roseiconus lacunae]|uniref:GNAT family N-acetyltransferase n=1 Tax=Roseiconus lacunae TaxID=2605694 RepID=UPI0030909EFB|nr:GNAT family N-acetyltransferase [Stieleria sp. HD01]
MPLRIELIDRSELLSDDVIEAINRLAPHPFQRFEWMGSWLEAFQSTASPFLLAVYQKDEIIGIAPWCLQRRAIGGRTIAFIGSGKACTDHLTISVGAGNKQRVTYAIARWLTAPEHQSLWDSLELVGVDLKDETINELATALNEAGLDVERESGAPCFAVPLPDSWDQYVQLRSKSGRREIRQSLRQIEDGTLKLDRIRTCEELGSHWHQFVALHQKRRDDAGTTNCFDYPGFDTFLKLAASRLLESGYLQFYLAYANDKPVCAHFAIADQDTWSFYQSGMDPDASAMRPGLSVFCHTIRESIESGRKTFDMMRGDEPYKLRWRAEEVATQVVRTYSRSGLAQIRKQVSKTGVTFKNIVKSGISLGTSRT